MYSNCAPRPRPDVSYSWLFAGHGRFFGELWPGRWDSLHPATMKFESDLPNDLEALKALSRTLMTELKKETTQNFRFTRFCTRLAKKLVCLGQMSYSEMQTSVSLGIKVDVSNLPWLVNGGAPWQIIQTLDAGTSTDAYLWEVPEGTYTTSSGSSPQALSMPMPETQTASIESGTDMAATRLELENQEVEDDQFFSGGDSELQGSAGLLEPEELSQLLGLSDTSVLSEPVELINPRARRRRAHAELFASPYRAPFSESGFNMKIPDSLVFLHKAGDFLYKESSETCCTPTLSPLGGFKTSPSAPQIQNSVSTSLQNARKTASENGSTTSSSPNFCPSIGYRSLDDITDIGFFSTDQARQKMVQLEPDEDGLETILVMPDPHDPLTHYQERISTVEYIHEQLQTELQEALKSAMEISEIASYIATTVNDRGSSINGLARNQSSTPAPFKITASGNKKSKIPVRVQNFASPNTSSTYQYGEPKSEPNVTYQLLPDDELPNSGRCTEKIPSFAPPNTPRNNKGPAKRRNGTMK